MVGAILWQFLTLAMIHYIISWVGLLFVKAEILRTGNEQLLNNLKEGVIIIDKENGVVMFLNRAAKKFNIHLNKALGMRIV